MKRLTTSMDQHGRMLIPAHLRERLNLRPGEKVTLEINHNQITIINSDDVIDEMHAIFTKNKTVTNGSVVDDFIKQKRQEHLIEEARNIKND